MKRVHLGMAAGTLAVALLAAAAGAQETLCVMTYNVRYASEQPGEAWSERRPWLAQCIRAAGPDVIGTQEGLYRQIGDMAADLPEMAWIGLGRQGGSHDEFVAIFYRTARLEVLEYDHFWLSDTPELIGSMTWGNQYRRMVTWVRFRDRVTQREFYLWNTHFDHQVQVAREKSAALIRERVARLDPALPVILLGDFNADGATNSVHAALVGDGFFRDTWDTAASRRGGLRGTFNAFGAFPPGHGRIDWILTRGAMQVQELDVVEFAMGGRFPSDHFPVVVRLRLGDAAEPGP